VIVKYTIKEIQAFASASSIAQEVLQNIRTVTAFHGQRNDEERQMIIIYETLFSLKVLLDLDLRKI
jgi:hypothetical protein